MPLRFAPFTDRVMRSGILMIPNKIPNPWVMLFTNSCFNLISGVKVCIRKEFSLVV